MSYWPKDKSTVPLLFVHIPKTAGISVQKWYRSTYGKFHKSMHGGLSHPILSEVNKTMESFCVVRNPYDLVYSWYRYKRQMLNETRHKDPTELEVWDRGFDYWLPRYIEKVNYTTDKSRPGEFNPISPGFSQLSYLKNTNGNIVVNYVLRFETLEKDFEIIKEITGSKNGLGFENQTLITRSNYKNVYSVSNRILIDRIYSEDLEYFGYEF